MLVVTSTKHEILDSELEESELFINFGLGLVLISSVHDSLASLVDEAIQRDLAYCRYS